MVWNKGLTKADPRVLKYALKNKVSKLGQKPWNTGLKYPAPWLDEFRFGNRAKVVHNRGKYTEAERKEIWGAARRGKKMHPNTKKALTKWIIEHPKEIRKKLIKGWITRSKRHTTSIEKIVYDKLKDWGIIYETQKVINGKFLVDAYLPDYKIIIEVDGVYWHNLDKVKKKDKAENAYLKKCGYKVIRIPEKEVSDFSIATLAKKGGE